MTQTSSGHRGPDMFEDPRAVRTRATLKQALMVLLQQEDWHQINISALCRRAGVARSSFYEHFDTKSDLLDEIFSDMLSEIQPSPRPSEPLATLEWLVSHVETAPQFFSRAMAGRRGDGLLPRFRAALESRLKLELSLRDVTEPAGKAAYIIGGTMSYLAELANGDVRQAIHHLAARIMFDDHSR